MIKVGVGEAGTQTELQQPCCCRADTKYSPQKFGDRRRKFPTLSGEMDARKSGGG
jgi:hypothetical protein